MKKRKSDHLSLALKSQIGLLEKDQRFDYEPLLNANPSDELEPFNFLGKQMRAPIWISSMTGGTEDAEMINKNLALAAKEFGLGMGLGSCRIYLEEKKYKNHFDLRKYIGDDQPFYANLGIGQIEKSLSNNDYDRIIGLVEELRTDGLIIHVNPIQEWLQPEGDVISRPPIETIQEFLDKTNLRVIVKEVGQGIGPASMRELLKLPLEGVEFAAFGGTNFAKVELQRGDHISKELYEPLSYVGNDAYEMIESVNEIISASQNVWSKYLIISGGIRNFLDGHYLIEKSEIPAVYGQASQFLKFAREDYQVLKEYIQYQLKGLQLAKAYLKVKE